ncbi:HDOD domain-containing protein [Massilia sp. 9I]|uniref:HDOD domain-containing protein n=1 Tax=Massilia sp. 9I TaxID=2653152 RepID=UPI001E2C1B4C|nr:HDOD domain-containing protein [Massilia sp. 9I]
MNKLEAFGYIAAQAARGDITFPTSVNAVLRLQLALDDPDCHVDEAIRLVLSEPQLAARTVALANTAAYGSGAGGAQVNNVRAAVLRIGYRRLRGLVAALMVRQFGHRIADPLLRARAEQLWTHSVQVAALAQALARHVTKVDPDTALFAGIVHEVGGFYLLSRADEFPGLLEDDTENWGVLVEDVASVEIMRKLAIPADVADAVCGLRDAVLSQEPQSLLDTLVLANRYAMVASPLGGVGQHDDYASGPLDAATLQLLRSEAADTAQALGDVALV